VACQRFVESERSFGKILVYGIPVWAIELALPVGFAVIAVRLLYRASETWRDRFAAAALASVMGVLVLTVPEASTRLFVPALLVLAVAVVIGAPAVVAVRGTALILFCGIEVPIEVSPAADS